MEESVPFSGRLDVEMNNLWTLCEQRGWFVPLWIKADPKDITPKYEDLHKDKIDLDEKILDNEITGNSISGEVFR